MYDNFHYPAGADTPDAPWNEKEIPEVEMQCDVIVTLRKDGVVVFTNNYDNNGEFCGTYHDAEELVSGQHKSIPELLDELAKYINGELAGGNISQMRRQELEAMLEDCRGWSDEIDVDDYRI